MDVRGGCKIANQKPNYKWWKQGILRTVKRNTCGDRIRNEVIKSKGRVKPTIYTKT